MIRNVIISLMLCLALLGCGRQQSGDVVARVNGHCLTADELSRRAEIMASLSVHRSGRAKDAARIRAIYQKGYAKFWVESRVLSDYAEKAGLVVSDEILEKHRQAAFARFKVKGDADYAQLISATVSEKDRSLWEGQVRDEGVRTLLKRHFAEQYPTNFGDAYATAEIAKMMAHNARMALTNAVQYAKATNAWQRICRGEDFFTVGRDMTEIEEERADNCEWLAVDAKMLSDEPALEKALKTMKPGDVTPPIASDNGLAIIRFDRVEDDGAKALSRIFFHLPRFLQPAPKEKIIRRAEDDYAQDLYRRKAAELVAAAKPEYFKNEQNTKKKAKGK